MEASPGNSFTWYNLACAQARAGAKRDAIDSLATALELGLPFAQQIERDDDLDSLRQEPEFAALLARVRGVAPSP